MTDAVGATGVIVVAAGSGTRLAAGIPKAFVELGGRTMLDRALDAVPRDAYAVAVVAADRVASTRDALGDRAVVVAGGPSRQASVLAGLDALPDEVGVVLVHDAARPLTPPAVFERVRDAVAAEGCGVIPVVPVADTIKRVDDDGAVRETVPRDELRAVQTPQGFPRAALLDAYRRADREYTDDAALFQAVGRRVVAVEGDPDAGKITTAWDLARARRDLAHPEFVAHAADATGVGVDVHAFGGTGLLRLGGLIWPGEQSLEGHSDGDAVLHALCDAFLSAAGLGDIGSVFGTDDPRYAGAESDVFVTEALRMLHERGLHPVSAAVEIVAAHPRIGPRRDELAARLGALVGAPVGVAGTTSDRLGVTGRGEGIAAIATVLVRRAAPDAPHGSGPPVAPSRGEAPH